MGHAAVYAVLGVLVARGLGGGALRDLSLAKASAAVLITTLYGVTDECHQVFVPTRSAEVLDVVADAVGALAGAGGAWAWSIYFTPGRPSATRPLDHPRQTHVVRKHHRDPRRAGGDRHDQPASRPERAERPDD
jgi:hypothetical protein